MPFRITEIWWNLTYEYICNGKGIWTVTYTFIVEPE